MVLTVKNCDVGVAVVDLWSRLPATGVLAYLWRGENGGGVSGGDGGEVLVQVEVGVFRRVLQVEIA